MYQNVSLGHVARCTSPVLSLSMCDFPCLLGWVLAARAVSGSSVSGPVQGAVRHAGKTRSIGATHRAHRRSGCNGRLKVDGSGAATVGLDREGYSGVVVPDGCETGMFGDGLDGEAGW